MRSSSVTKPASSSARGCPADDDVAISLYSPHGSDRTSGPAPAASTPRFTLNPSSTGCGRFGRAARVLAVLGDLEVNEEFKRHRPERR